MIPAKSTYREEEEEEVEEGESEDEGSTSEGTSSSDDEAGGSEEEELGADEFVVDEVRIEGLPEPGDGVPSEVNQSRCLLSLHSAKKAWGARLTVATGPIFFN